MRKSIRRFSVLVLGIVAISLSACNTCGTKYRRELSGDYRLREANTSYKKAIRLLDKAECEVYPAPAKESFVNAESYLSDTIFKLKEVGHDKNIDVSEEVYYCEKMKRETDTEIGIADKAMMSP